MQIIERKSFSMYEINEIRRPQTVNSLERDHSDFIANSGFHRYPMQCKQHRGNMTVPGCKGDTSRRGIPEDVAS